jgi:iron(III) transport system ATP-binding protein
MEQGYLSLRNLAKRFGKHTALQDVQLDIAKNEFICLLGPSGCGKTTLLRILAGLEKTDQGSVVIAGKDITSLPAGKRNFGMMFQSYALFPNLTVSENIAYGLRNRFSNSKWNAGGKRCPTYLLTTRDIRSKRFCSIRMVLC